MKSLNEVMKEQNKNYSFDIVSTLKDIFRNWFIVLIVGIVAGMGSFIVVTQMYKPQYSASITLLVQSKTNSQNVYDSLTATTKLAGVFKNILDSSQLQNAAAESLGYSQFPGTLSCSIVEETNILSFSVKSDSPIKSYRLLNAVLDSYPQFTKNVVSSIVLQTLEEPVVPVSPNNNSNATRAMMLGFLIGVLLTVAIIAVLSYYKDTIKKESDIEKKLNVKRVVSIPKQKKKISFKEKIKGVKKSLSLANPVISFEFRESFKKLRRIIVSDSKNNSHKVFSVTSSLENEGKTTIAVNVAMALGKMDYKVLLIDADLRKPAVTKFLDKKLPEGKELTDFLNGNARLSDIMHYDEINNITVAGCNKGTTLANELVTSDKMEYLFSVGREKYDYVIVDTSPLGFVSDAEDVLSISDSALLVVRRDIANALTINDTVDIILSTDVKLLGCVYNDSEAVKLTGNNINYSSYGGYGYGKYGYGYGTAGK